jgi:RNA polymerase sigma factor (sigma-70 family)
VEFYRAHWGRLVAALRWAVPEDEDPRDAAQEAMVRAYERWQLVRAHARPDAWLFLTAYRVATGLRRRAILRRTRTPLSHAVDRDVGNRIEFERLLRQLTARQRTALLLRHHYGLSTSETAHAMRCREGTVKSLLSRGREALRSAVSTEDE